jgi:hypothetical protein
MHCGGDVAPCSQQLPQRRLLPEHPPEVVMHTFVEILPALITAAGAAAAKIIDAIRAKNHDRKDEPGDGPDDKH